MVDELGDERKEEQRCFRVQSFGSDPLPKGVTRGHVCSFQRAFHRPCLEDHLHAYEAEICRAGIFDSSKSQCRFGQDDRYACSGSEYVRHATNESTQRRKHSFALTTRQAPGEYIEHSGTWCDGQQNGRADKEQEFPRFRHDQKLYPASEVMRSSQRNLPDAVAGKRSTRDLAVSGSPAVLRIPAAIPHAAIHHSGKRPRHRTRWLASPRWLRQGSRRNRRPPRTWPDRLRPSSFPTPPRRSQDVAFHGPQFPNLLCAGSNPRFRIA